MSPLPDKWYEVKRDKPADIQTALDLLEGTFPYRYLHLKRQGLTKKMKVTREVDAANNKVPSLQLFIWKPGTKAGIAAFFFIRFLSGYDRVHCLSVGIDHTVVTTADALYDQLVLICEHMQGEIGEINVVNQREIGVNDDLGDTPNRSTLVKGAFDKAVVAGKLLDVGGITARPPWPSELYCWEVAELSP